MRPIKFRAWDKKRNKWYSFGVLISEFGGLWFLDANRNLEPLDATQVDIVWFTGLKDKNGKEIYEGDIVHYKYDFRGSDNWGVAWGDDGWIMRRENRQTGDDNCFDDPHHNNWSCAEIIGNIYENPELLK